MTFAFSSELGTRTNPSPDKGGSYKGFKLQKRKIAYFTLELNL